MNHDEIRELAAVYALGGLDGEDRSRFEALLASGDPEATAALGEFEATLVALAKESPEAPPPSVKAALSHRIAAAAATAAPAAVVTPLRPRRILWPFVWAGLMAAGVAAIVVGLAISHSYEKRLQALGQEAAALRVEVDRERQLVDILRDPTTEIVALAGLEPAPAARARMIWNARGGGLLVAAGLPPVPAGKAYQLWAIAGKAAPVPAGVFTVDTKGTGSLRVPALVGVTKVDVFAVTLEPAGGLPAPTGPMYLAGKA